MYEEVYKLSGNPFKLTPNPEFFYPSRIHKKVMAYLQYGLEQGDGFIVVTGNVGTGKTTIIQTLTNELEKENDIILSQITSTQLTEGELIRMVSVSFGLPINKLSKAALIKNLENFLREQSHNHKRVLLIVDEVQNMPKRSLEELRMLSNFQEQGRQLFQSFLVGQQQFKKIINRADMEQLRQRVIASYHLDPLDIDDTKNYIEYRLECVGWQRDPEFDAAAYDKIFSFSQGVPRIINIFCGRLLLYAALEDIHTITEEVVSNVISEFADENMQKKFIARSDKKSDIDNVSDTNRLDAMDKRLRIMERKLKRIEVSVDTLVDDFNL